MNIYVLVNGSCNTGGCPGGGTVMAVSDNKLPLQKMMKAEAVKTAEKYKDWNLWLREGKKETTLEAFWLRKEPMGEEFFVALNEIEPSVTDRILFQKVGDSGWYFDFYIDEAEFLSEENPGGG